ncbi:MAG: hypothetical protein V1843_02860, partial [bacterium]
KRLSLLRQVSLDQVQKAVIKAIDSEKDMSVDEKTILKSFVMTGLICYAHYYEKWPNALGFSDFFDRLVDSIKEPEDDGYILFIGEACQIEVENNTLTITSHRDDPLYNNIRDFVNNALLEDIHTILPDAVLQEDLIINTMTPKKYNTITAEIMH